MTQFKDITVKYWLYIQLKNGLKNGEKETLIPWFIEIPQTFCFTLPKSTSSVLFFGNFVAVFNKKCRI